MDRNKIKNDVLQDLIDLMDQKNLEGLKSKSPKFMKLEMEADKPEPEPMEEESDEQAEEMDNMRRLKEIKGDVQDKHMDMADPMGKFKDPFKQSHMDVNKLNESKEEDEDLERLKALYEKLK